MRLDWRDGTWMGARIKDRCILGLDASESVIAPPEWMSLAAKLSLGRCDSRQELDVVAWQCREGSLWLSESDATPYRTALDEMQAVCTMNNSLEIPKKKGNSVQ